MGRTIAIPIVALLAVAAIPVLAGTWYSGLVAVITYDYPTSEGLDHATITYIGPGPDGTLILAGEYGNYAPYAYTDAYVALLLEPGLEVLGSVEGGRDDKPLAAWVDGDTVVVAGAGASWDREFDPPETEGFVAYIRGATVTVYSYDPAGEEPSSVDLATYREGAGLVFAGNAEGPVVIIPDGGSGTCWVQTSPFVAAIDDARALDHDGERILVSGNTGFLYASATYFYYTVYSWDGDILYYKYVLPEDSKSVQPEDALLLDNYIVVAGTTDAYTGDYRGLDAFILYAQADTILWTLTIGAPGHDHALHLARDGENAIVAISLDYEDYKAVLVASFTPNGSLAWASLINTTWANTTLNPTALYYDGSLVHIAIPIVIEYELTTGQHLETLLLAFQPGEEKTITLGDCNLALCHATITITPLENLEEIGLTTGNITYQPLQPTAQPETQPCNLNIKTYQLTSETPQLIATIQAQSPTQDETTTPPPTTTQTTTTTTQPGQTTTTTTQTTTQTTTTSPATYTTTQPPQAETTQTSPETGTSPTVQPPPQTTPITGTPEDTGQPLLPVQLDRTTTIVIGAAAAIIITIIIALVVLRRRTPADYYY